MQILQHPLKVLDRASLDTIRQEAPVAIYEKKLTQNQLNLIYEQEWLRLFIPKRYRGLEMDLPQALQILEALAYADGSLGWTVNLGAGANLFAAYIRPSMSEQIFTDKRACIAGSGAMGGSATPEENGYRVRGHWKYGSGSSHATAFTANCKLPHNGKASDLPGFHSFVFFPDEVQVKDTWDSYGLQATASHDFAVEEQWLPEERTFSLLKPSPYEDGPLYRFPFMQFAEITTCLQLTGMAMHFLDEARSLLMQKRDMAGESLKDNMKVQDMLAQSEAGLESARAWLYVLVQEAWQQSVSGNLPSDGVLRKTSLAVKHAAQAARESAEKIYPLTGMTVLSTETELNRCWRDLHTASQHTLLSPLDFAGVK
jgi:indole-3-acetate monooxygenase